MTILVDEKIGKQGTRAWPDLLEGRSAARCFMVPFVAASLEEETPIHVSTPAPRETEGQLGQPWTALKSHPQLLGPGWGGVLSPGCLPEKASCPPTGIPKPMTWIGCRPWAASPDSADSGKAGQVISLVPAHPPGLPVVTALLPPEATEANAGWVDPGPLTVSSPLASWRSSGTCGLVIRVGLAQASVGLPSVCKRWRGALLGLF